MKKEIRQIIKKDGQKIVQITTYDERWYAREVKDKKTGLPEYKFYPSVTWITSYYPKGIGFMKWLASKGWDEAELAKEEGGKKGYKVHLAASALLQGQKVAMTDAFPPEFGAEPEELKPDEYECLMNLVDWVNSMENFEVIASEYTAFNEKDNYAGTIDLICRIDGQLWLVDFKISSHVWPSHEIQLAAYAHLDVELEGLGISEKEWKEKKLAILQLGYNRNQKGWKFTEVSEQYDLFLAIYKIWEKECAGVEPSQKDYPLELEIKKLARKNAKSKR